MGSGRKPTTQTLQDTLACMENLQAAIKNRGMTKSILMMCLNMSVHYSPLAPHASEQKKKGL